MSLSGPKATKPSSTSTKLKKTSSKVNGNAVEAEKGVKAKPSRDGGEKSGKTSNKGKEAEKESKKKSDTSVAPGSPATLLSKPSKTKAMPKKGILKTAKPSQPEPTNVEVDEEAEEEAEEASEKNGKEDEEIMLTGFSSESDSSDEEDGVDDEPIDVGKLPTIAKDDASVKRKLEKAKKQSTSERGVIYLGRIPHGFYENEMKGYFSQFGDVTRLRLSRNKRTGRSKHYAFLEFSSASVAEIVAETMDNYLLMGHILRCKLIPKDEVHPELWIGANRKFKRVPIERIARLQQNKPRTNKEQMKAEHRLLKRQAEKKRKLQAAGIDYDLDAAGYRKRAKQGLQSS